MQQYITFRRKKRKGPAPALTPGNRYEVLDVRGNVVLIRNDRGVNKWYYRDAFEDPQPSGLVPDLSAATPEQKEGLIKGLLQITAKELLKMFMACGVKAFIETMIVNDPTNESFFLSFRKIGVANPSNEEIEACLKAVGTGLDWSTVMQSPQEQSGNSDLLTSNEYKDAYRDGFNAGVKFQVDRERNPQDEEAMEIIRKAAEYVKGNPPIDPVQLIAWLLEEDYIADCDPKDMVQHYLQSKIKT